MSWETKKDYAGLAGDLLKVKESDPGRSSQFLEKLGQNGTIAATKLYGEKSGTASTTYTIIKAGKLKIQPGKVTTVDSERYALQNVVYTKSAGGEPTLVANSVRIEDTTDGVDQMFEEVEIDIDPEETAEFCIDCATVSGSGCEVTEVATTVGCTVNLHTINGDPVASGVHTGKIEVDITIGKYGDAEPTVEAKQGWEVAQNPQGADPDSDMPSLTAKVMKPLAKAP